MTTTWEVVYLKKAIKKYGRENFERIILHFCFSSQEAYLIEAQIVDENFINRSNTYNAKTGGVGGWDYPRSKTNPKSEENIHRLRTMNIGRKQTQETKQILSNAQKQRKRTDEELKRVSELGKANKGKKHKESTILLIKQNWKQPVIKQSEESNDKRRVRALERCIDPTRHCSYVITSPDNKEYKIVGMLSNFAKEHNLSINTLRYYFNKGTIHQISGQKITEKVKNTLGWSITRIEPKLVSMLS